MSARAGTAVRDISPPSAVQLAGYPHRARVSTGIHDPLLASVLYIDDGREAVLLGSLDLLMINSHVARKLRRRVAEALSLPEASVLLSCTHTHSGPVAAQYLPFDGDPAMPQPDPHYLELVGSRLVDAAREARSRTVPAACAWVSADGRGVGGNRHSPDEVTDPEVRVLAIRDDQRWVAVVVVYGMHPTVLHEDSTLVSADFPCAVRQYLGSRLGPGVTVQYHTAPCGNQSPRHVVRAQTFAEAERLGFMLGAAVERSLAGVLPGTEVRIASALRSVVLPRRSLPSPENAEILLARARLAYERLKTEGGEKGALRTLEVGVFGAETTVRLSRAHNEGRLDALLGILEPFEVQALRIGDCALVGVPGELFVEYSLEIKKRTPPGTAVVAFANGELQGYIVTARSASLGGYEAASRVFEPEAGNILVEAAVHVVEHAWAQG